MRLLFPADAVWYDSQFAQGENKVSKWISEHPGKSLRQKAAKIYQEQVALYDEQSTTTSADKEWLKTLMNKGTLNDRISAALLQFQEAPIYGLEWLTRLLMLASSSSRHESFPAIEALRDAFLLVLPPSEFKRPLRAWNNALDGTLAKSKKSSKPMQAPFPSPSDLFLAYFEDVLRQTFIEFLRILEIMLHEQLVSSRERALRYVFDLIRGGKDEQVTVLINLLVHKLGDPERKIASRVVYYLQCSLEGEERLMMRILQLVQDQVLKSPQSNDKAAYYGLIFMSEIKLSGAAPEVTRLVVKTYQHVLSHHFQTFEERRKLGPRRKKGRFEKKGHQAELPGIDFPRIVKVALTGFSRAVPFCDSSVELGEYAAKIIEISSKIQSYGTLLQATTLIVCIFNHTVSTDQASIQSLSSLLSNHLLNYRRLADASGSYSPLFKLLYKIFTIFARDNSVQSLSFTKGTAKALLQLATLIAIPAFPAATLLLLSRLLMLRPALRSAISFPEEADADSSADLFWELNILAKHYHPTVSRYAQALLSGTIDLSVESQDPFTEMTHAAFLVDFSQKKKSEENGEKGRTLSIKA